MDKLKEVSILGVYKWNCDAKTGQLGLLSREEGDGRGDSVGGNASLC